MCLTFKKPGPQELLTARKDITVYKHVIDNTVRFDPRYLGCPRAVLTSYQKAIVLVDNETVYESELRLRDFFEDPGGMCFVDLGLHSFAQMETAGKEAKSYGEALVECVIPKGAKYYEGQFEPIDGRRVKSYASDKLKYVKVLKDYYEERKKELEGVVLCA